MMQDTVLTICHESVASFHDYVLGFIPEETHITDTATVTNKFKAKEVEETPAENNESDSELEEDQDLAAEEDENDPVRKRIKEIDAEFAKEKVPAPLFVLDLVLKQG